MLKGIRLAKQKENLTILSSVDIEVQKGRITGVMSLDHRETSNLLKILSGYVVPSSGDVELDEQKLKSVAHRGFFPYGISIIPGVERLLPDLSVFHNLQITLAGLWPGKKPLPNRSETMKKITPLLAQFDFSPSPGTLVKALTWEEQQKLAVIQCLLEESEYLLIEKVTSALPVNAIENFWSELRIRRDKGCGILFVPDNPNQIFDLCDEVVILRNGKNVFRRGVTELDVDEIYNILNNTDYTINQSIENKFHQFNSTLSNMESLLNRTLKVLGNFCALYQSFALWREDGDFHVIRSKYWNPAYPLGTGDFAPGLAKRLSEETKGDGFINYDETNWFYNKIAETEDYQVYILMKCDDEPGYPLPRILRELGTSVGLLLAKLKEEQEKKHREFESMRLSQEMNIAKNIQSSILPKSLDLPGYSVAAFMETATEVGGDGYEVMATPLGNFIGIGDVSGHGLPSGIMALIETAAFHGAVQAHISLGMKARPDKIYDIINKVLCTLNRDRIGSDKFMTKILILEQNGNFVHAGSHLIGLCYRKEDRKVVHLHDMIDKTAYLGISEHIESSSSISEFYMNPGDTLLLYTDGLVEARNQNGEFFGLDGVSEVFARSSMQEPAGLLKSLRDAAFAFAQTGDIQKNQGHFEDDVSMVALRRLEQ